MTMRHSFGILVWLSTLLAAELSRGSIIDQVNPPPAGVGVNSGTGQIWQQEVTADLSGQLVGVDVRVDVEGFGFDFFVNRGSPFQSDPHDFAVSTLSGPAGNWTFIDTTAAGIFLDINDQFVIGLEGSGQAGASFLFLGSTGNAYKGGQLFWKDGANAPEEFFDGTRDLLFRTHVNLDAQPVPEPGTVTLAALGLMGLFFCSTRRLKRLAAAACIGVVLYLPASDASAISWSAGGGGSFLDGGNWTGGSVLDWLPVSKAIYFATSRIVSSNRRLPTLSATSAGSNSCGARKSTSSSTSPSGRPPGDSALSSLTHAPNIPPAMTSAT